MTYREKYKYKNNPKRGVDKDRVKGNIYCPDAGLTSLEGAPKYVRGGFNCTYNKLTSLEGAPEYIRGSFLCYNNKLTSLEGAPEYVGGDFYCDDNLKEGENIYIIINSLINGKLNKGTEAIKEILLEYFTL